MSVLAAVGLLSSVVPAIAGWFGGDDAEDVASDVVNIAKKVTGIADPDEAAQAISNNPELAKVFETQAHEYRLAKLKAETEIVKEVNATMRVEANAEHWSTKTWRPFWGFASGASFFLVSLAIAVALCVLAIKDPAIFLTQLPAICTALAALFAIPGAILGVTAYQRGKMQAIKAGSAFNGKSLLDVFKKDK